MHFFVRCTDYKESEIYSAELENTIFVMFELGFQYSEIMNIPVLRFHNYLKWKEKRDEEKKKQLEKQLSLT